MIPDLPHAEAVLSLAVQPPALDRPLCLSRDVPVAQVQNTVIQEAGGARMMVGEILAGIATEGSGC